MDKLKMAHDWYMKHSEGASFMYTEVDQAWKYADAMQAEADKREDKTRPEVLEEWQPDWSQAPEWAVAWTKDEIGAQWWGVIPSHGCGVWFAGDGVKFRCVEAPEFNYDGRFVDSLRKRP